MHRSIVAILSLFLIMNIVSCASAPPLSMPNDKLLSFGTQDGIIIGSVNIKTVKYKGSKIFKYKIKNKKCVLTLFKSNKKIEGPDKLQVTAVADGKEVPFVAVLPAGKYTFKDVEIKIFNDPRRGHMRAFFDVIPGQTTYIGKLDIKLPEYGRYGIYVDLKIKDTQELTISNLRSGEYTNLREKISKRIMSLGE